MTVWVTVRCLWTTFHGVSSDNGGSSCRSNNMVSVTQSAYTSDERNLMIRKRETQRLNNKACSWYRHTHFHGRCYCTFFDKNCRFTSVSQYMGKVYLVVKIFIIIGILWHAVWRQLSREPALCFVSIFVLKQSITSLFSCLLIRGSDLTWSCSQLPPVDFLLTNLSSSWVHLYLCLIVFYLLLLRHLFSPFWSSFCCSLMLLDFVFIRLRSVGH